uniref:Sepiapterin reductase n=1 Tax=Trichobilharzia regenti TaxID=157069 RepID=A0AA85IU43_TRIRE|nr:unnamed protein product [Trichobilharzia regenti]
MAMSYTDNCTCGELSSNKSPWCGANCFVAVTGASRGFGQAFCIELVKSMSSGEDHAASLNILLMARDVNALRITESKMNASKSSHSTMKLNILVSTSSLDMSNADEKVLREELAPLFRLSLELSHQDTNVSQWIMLVHNAATLGNVQSRTDERFNIQALDTYYRMNLTAPMILTSLFLEHFAPSSQSLHHPVTIVNISSLAAVQPFPCMSDYCVGKAARQMYLKCLCVDRPSIAVFNYSPGPLDTAMFKQILEGHGDEKTRQAFSQMKVNGRIVEPLESARVCVAWLRKQIPISGAETSEENVPKLSHCSIHQSQYSDVWIGSLIDYFDAVREVK